jgi:hypothetical protein
MADGRSAVGEPVGARMFEAQCPDGQIYEVRESYGVDLPRIFSIRRDSSKGQP